MKLDQLRIFVESLGSGIKRPLEKITHREIKPVDCVKTSGGVCSLSTAKTIYCAHCPLISDCPHEAHDTIAPRRRLFGDKPSSGSIWRPGRRRDPNEKPDKSYGHFVE